MTQTIYLPELKAEVGERGGNFFGVFINDQIRTAAEILMIQGYNVVFGKPPETEVKSPLTFPEESNGNMLIEQDDVYILAIINEKGEWRYIGYCPHREYDAYETDFRKAARFSSIARIKEIIAEHPEFSKRAEFDGESVPPSIIHGGLRINYENPKMSGHFVIQKVSVSNMEFIPVSDEIKKTKKCCNCCSCECLNNKA